MDLQDIAELTSDKVIRERSRLLVLTFLASSEKRTVSFTELQEAFGFTPGNLSIQLKTLKKAAYITITKEFRANKPLTSVRITVKGSTALTRYVEGLHGLVTRLRENGAKRQS